MAETNLTQNEADILIRMEKQYVQETIWPFAAGVHLAIPLTSMDKRENFILDVTRAQIKLTKATYQNRAHQAVILIRLDLDGPPHRNPDGEEIPCPHLHVFREGFGTKWAVPAPVDKYSKGDDLYSMFQAFMQHCNITSPPSFQFGLF